MDRFIEKDLIEWKDRKNRMPLLLRGARQVGKTYVIEKFGEQHFHNLVTIDFERDPEVSKCFKSFDPENIIRELELYTNSEIAPGKTLLFLDEIQVCPEAIMALRYFKEEMAGLHVIGAGSLLEFALNDERFRMPVGRVQYLFLKPLSFEEYLSVSGYSKMLDRLQEVTLEDPLDPLSHSRCLALSREYAVLGGMPAVISEYLETKSYYQCQNIQTSLLKTYRDDFGKYAKFSQHKYLQMLFERVPGLIGKWFKYSKVDPSVDPRAIRPALQMLEDAGLLYLVHSTSASGIPLISTMNTKKFKLFFLDVGLVHRASLIDLKLLLHEDLMLLNRGVIAEQFVAQELLACTDRYEKGSLFFWTREKKGSSAEIDFLIQVGAQIVPIEVKAGSTGRLKSLKLFMEEKETPIGVRISQQPLSLENGILSIPLYLIGQLPRLVRSF